MLQSDTAPAERALPPLFAGLVPEVLDDGTVAIYGVDAYGDRTPQPLVVEDAGLLAFFATALDNAVRAAR